jgi:hypothetical protein
MTPPDSASNRTIAGIAAALGIAIGVAPASLLAQDTAHATGAEVAKNVKIGAAQDKAALGATNNKLNSFTYNKSVAGTGGSAAGKVSTLDKSTPPLNQQKELVGTQYKAQAGQFKSIAPPGNQMKGGLPAVQGKGAYQMKTVTGGQNQAGLPAVQDKSATQMKAVTGSVNQGGLPAVQQKAAIQNKEKTETPQ